MSNFNRDNNNYGPRRNSGRNDFGRPRFQGRDDGRAELHDAVCANCGNDCQVPFRPNGRKPVLCKNCFKQEHNGAEPRRPQGRDSHRDNFERKDESRGPQKNLQLEAIERKLDKVIKLLSGTYAGPVKTEKPEKAKVEKAKKAKKAAPVVEPEVPTTDTPQVIEPDTAVTEE